MSNNIRYHLGRGWRAVPRAAKHLGKESWQLLNLGINPEKTPIFIVGCQRSGTTMFLEILDQSPYTKIYGEPRSGWRPGLIRLDQDIIDHRVGRTFASHPVFKPLIDSQYIDEFLAGTPGSRAIWVYRNHHDTAKSAVKKWGDHQLTIIRRIATDDYDGRRSPESDWRYERLSEATVNTIKRLYADDLTPHEGALLFWYVRHNLYQELNLLQSPDVLLVKYRDLVLNPSASFEQVFDFVDLPFSTDYVGSIFQQSVGKPVQEAVRPAIEDLCQQMLTQLDHWGQQPLSTNRATVEAIPV